MWLRPEEWGGNRHSCPHPHAGSDRISMLEGTLETPGSVSHASAEKRKHIRTLVWDGTESRSWLWHLLAVWSYVCEHNLSWWSYNQSLWEPLWGLSEAKHLWRAVAWARIQQAVRIASTCQDRRLPRSWPRRTFRGASRLTSHNSLLPSRSFHSRHHEAFSSFSCRWASVFLNVAFNYWLWLCLLDRARGEAPVSKSSPLRTSSPEIRDEIRATGQIRVRTVSFYGAWWMPGSPGRDSQAWLLRLFDSGHSEKGRGLS